MHANSSSARSDRTYPASKTADQGAASGDLARAEWIVALCMLGLSAAIVAPNLLARISVYDGGIAASAGTFMLHGLLPYRDFWLLYGPLSGLVVAVPTLMFGPSIELVRGVGVLVFLGQALAAYLIVRVWAAPVVAAVISVSAVVMLPALLGLELSAWSLAMTLGLAALYLSIGTTQSGLLVGAVVGLTFITRFDVGAYTLLAVLLVRDRRTVLLGFGAIAVPFAVWAIATTNLGSLFEQLIWYPLVGPRQFRGLPGPDAQVGDAGPIMALPLSLIPRALIVLSFVSLAVTNNDHRPLPHARGLLALAVFALLCQLQTQARGDLEHLGEAATPAILLLAVWYRHAQISLPRFVALAGTAALCGIVGLLSLRLIGSTSASTDDRAILASSAWIRQATDEDEAIFVGLTSHRFTTSNPLIVYYLADRRPAVHDTMFNPGVTNTDLGQTRMISDLGSTATPYLVLDRDAASRSEPSNESSIAGSTLLDTYLGARYHTVCDLGSLVIQVRNDLSRLRPPCPKIEP